MLFKKKSSAPDGQTERFDSEGNPIRRRVHLGKRAGTTVIIVAAAVIASNCYYVLDEENYAVVTTLGSPQAESHRDFILRFHLFRTSAWYPRVLKVCPSVITRIPERLWILNL